MLRVPGLARGHGVYPCGGARPMLGVVGGNESGEEA